MISRKARCHAKCLVHSCLCTAVAKDSTVIDTEPYRRQGASLQVVQVQEGFGRFAGMQVQRLCCSSDLTISTHTSHIQPACVAHVSEQYSCGRSQYQARGQYQGQVQE